MTNFSELHSQIQDGLILEDEMELAQLAVLIPDMMNALAKLIEACRDGEAILTSAANVLSKIQDSSDEGEVINIGVQSEMYPGEGRVVPRRLLSMSDDEE